MNMRPSDFWIFAEEVRCSRCGDPVNTREGLVVTVNGQFDGLIHRECGDEDGVETVQLRTDTL